MKKCLNCNKELPNDSEFCQYCGSKKIADISELNKVYKRCIDCGKELPKDSEFCQYCGSKRVAIVNEEDKVKKDKIIEKNRKGFFIPFIIAIIGCVCLGYGMYYNYRMTVTLNSKIKNIENENNDLSIALQNERDKNRENVEKIDKYNSIVNYAKHSNGYSDFYARQTILVSPHNEKVWIYFGHYNTNVWFQTSSGNVEAKWGEFNNCWAPITISYNGNGVEYVKLYNDANNEVFYITVIGN